MNRIFLLLSLLSSAALGVFASEEKLGIQVTRAVACDRKTRVGDTIDVHYHGTLQSTGDKFDASYDRNMPFTFPLGGGRVIRGWDEGLLDMCIGEMRTLTVPPSYGYGQRAMGPIPAGSTLIFKTELIGIKGEPQPETIFEKSTHSDAASAANEGAGADTKKPAEVVSVASAATEVVQMTAAVSDAEQEHNEL